MTDDQVAKLLSYVAGGCQLAIIHLGSILEQKGVITKSDLADSYDRTANVLADDMQGREMVEPILRGIARGLRQAAPAGPRPL